MVRSMVRVRCGASFINLFALPRQCLWYMFSVVASRVLQPGSNLRVGMVPVGRGSVDRHGDGLVCRPVGPVGKLMRSGHTAFQMS